jgi:hypothetical protein
MRAKNPAVVQRQSIFVYQIREREDIVESGGNKKARIRR